MKEAFDKSLFDLLMRVLNYSIEFARSPGYASLRFLDVFQNIIDIVLDIEDVSNRDFYLRVKEKMESRRLLSDSEERARFLDELLEMFIEEWRKVK
ncbi:MAG: hypothetical protein ACUVV4_07990 [Candidatus Bathyarchaeia archaeon]